MGSGSGSGSSSGSGSGSGSGSYNNWTRVASNIIKIQSSSTHNFYSKIIVDLFEIKIPYKNKITNAVVKLYAQNTSRDGYCYYLDSKIPIRQGYYSEFDVTRNIKDYENTFTVTIVPPEYDYYAEFAVSGANAPVLEVEYLTNDDAVPEVRSFSLVGGATGQLTLGTGEMIVSFDDMEIGSTSLPITISHIHKENCDDYGMGTDWKLNLNQTLVKYDKAVGTQYNVDYIYTDEKGEKHGFIETYYYIDTNGNKKSVNKDDVTVEADGTLWYILSSKTKYEVFIEHRTASGLKLKTRIEETDSGKVKRTELLEQRHEELQNVQDQIESLIETLAEMGYYYDEDSKEAKKISPEYVRSLISVLLNGNSEEAKKLTTKDI